MASNTVEQIFVELLLNAKGYNKDADEAVKKSEKLEKGLGGTEKQAAKTDKSIAKFTTGLGKAVKGVAGFAAVVAAGTGLLKLADEARKANDELNFLSKNLGMSSGEVKAWQGAAAAMGGSAQGMAGDMKGLNSSMNDFAMTGESSMLPMFNTLGVSMVDAQGKVRGTNDVMLDLADSMSKMDREQAFLMGQKLGFDEGTINTLLQGRDAMQEMVDYHKQMYTSNKQELEASRKLSENQAKLGAHWDSMKLMMGNAIIPLLVKLSNIALRFFEFLQRHQKTVKTVFEGMAIFLGMLVVPLLGKALVAALLFMAPFAPFILVVGLLGAAFIALYDDYKTWAEGGESLFNWGAFRGYIDNAKLSTENLGKGFLHLIGDYDSWSQVAEDGKSWLKLKGFIDENGVSLETLRKGFANLTTDLIQYMIPTLKEYGEIFQKLITGDFLGASKQAANMMANLGNKILSVFGTSGQEIADYISSGGQTRAPWQSAKDRISGAADVATGQPVGTLAGTSIMNNSAKSESVGVVNNGSTKPSGSDIVQVLHAGSGYNIVQLANGKIVKRTGSWNWRNNNPGNIEGGGDFAKSNRALDLKGASGGSFEKRFGVFPSYEAGKQAKIKLLFESGRAKNLSTKADYGKGLGYKDKSLMQAIASWAPPEDKNDTSAYQRKVLASVGNRNLKMHQYSTKEREAILRAMEQQEGYRVGKEEEVDINKLDASIRSRINKKAISAGATQAQATMPKNQIPASIAKPASTTNSNKVDVKVSTINVNTTASTLTGTMEDAIKGLNNNNLYQFPIGLNT